MSRLNELALIDEVIQHAIQDHSITLTPNETKIIAKHLLRLTSRDRQKAEQDRRYKIAKALRHAS